MGNRGEHRPDHQSKDKQQLEAAAEKLAEERVAEKKVVDKIVYWIVGILVLLVVVIGLLGANFVHSSLQAYDSDNNKTVVVKIPMGATNKQIGAILANEKVIKNAMIFNYYVKSHNFSEFQTGFYNLKPSMSLAEVTKKLADGGSQTSQYRVLIKEGATVEQVGTSVAKATHFSKKQFLALMKDQTFMQKLAKKYPELLSSSMAQSGVRYHLEGYLYPATYDYYQGMSLKELVTNMVEKTDLVMQPYYKQIKAKDLSVQQVLTLASLVEREGNNSTDRAKIAGVFFNRIDTDMPLQSDISVMYALNTHKKHLYNKDLAVKSPYNLYKNTGYGPGPFNNPSKDSIQAVLQPTDRDQDYLYFVADLKTGKVYYSQTFEEHTSTNNGIQTKNGDDN
ncbi:endolytic transglycosylase MltG [Loigolactobacillus zhaoyuanensis]|uniref:endolytic transglycosylase MltG n=1 Tax=Loigolactobacillus zhaoyuanensis TaxID=2486017 RepID=UPI000F73E103|nr:endolytic transglycosylase MltG [Loigolactobacillus zhaoyuanensis]